MAQEKARLQERKKLLLEEIQFSNKVLEQTKKEKDVSFHQLKTLKQKIEDMKEHEREHYEFFNEEIKKTAHILKHAYKKHTLLHCVSIYPTGIEDANLSRINPPRVS